MSRSLRSLWLLVRTAVAVSRQQSLLCLAESAGVVLSLLQPVLLALLVSGLIHRDQRVVVWTVVGLMAQLGLSRVGFTIGHTARAGQLDRVGHTFDNRVAMLTASIPTIDHLDDPAYLDQMQILREEQGSLGLAINTLLNTLNTASGVVGTLAIALSADLRLMLVMLAGVPTVLLIPLTVRWQAGAERDAAEPGRLAFRLLELATSAHAAGELRVFGLASRTRRRIEAATAGWRRPRTVQAGKEAVLTAATQLLFYATAGAVLSWLLADVFGGQVSVATFTLALLLIQRLQGISADARVVITNVAALARAGSRYLWLVDYHRQAMARHRGTRALPVRLQHGVVLRDAAYTYPQAGTPALRDVDLEFPAGSVVAIVGENGAGKSTLANLLAGLIVPTTGSLAIDGIDSRELDLDQWRARVSGAFQDHVRFEFRAGHTVGIGDLPQRDDTTAVMTALERGAATSVMAGLPAGLDTPLGATWRDGVELSGGQWQRLAIARGMMRPAPILRLLDEPTSALDAATEHQIFTRYIQAASRGRHDGTITVLITHRFSTVAAADLIVVLQHGRVTERGTHADLLAAGGTYAALYELQAAGYR